MVVGKDATRSSAAYQCDENIGNNQVDAAHSELIRRGDAQQDMADFPTLLAVLYMLLHSTEYFNGHTRGSSCHCFTLDKLFC